MNVYRPSAESVIRRARVYGVTPAELTEVINRHGGVCPACGHRNRDMVIDHCHETGQVRDYLCRTCNTEVGWIERGRTDIKHPYRPGCLAYVELWRARVTAGGGDETYPVNAASSTAPTVVPSAAALALAASHTSSGTRNVLTGVPLVGIDGDGRGGVAGGRDTAVGIPGGGELTEPVNPGHVVGERAGLAVDREHDVTDGELSECGLAGAVHDGNSNPVYYTSSGGCRDG